MHNAFLNIDNRKMSKSLGNFLLVRDIAKHYDLQVLRFFMLNAHYRSPLNFSQELMEAAKNALTRIITAVTRLSDLSAYISEHPAKGRENEAETLAQLGSLVTKFEDSMDDDCNTADALAAIFEMVKLANVEITEESTKEAVDTFLNTIVKLSDICGLIVKTQKETLDSDIEDLIAQRTQAKKDRDFAKADAIRAQLLDMGIVLEDTRQGTTWKRV